MRLENIIDNLHRGHHFSKGSIDLLRTKGFKKKEFEKLYLGLKQPNESFGKRRDKNTWIDTMLDRGDSEEITTGRYNRYVHKFKDISSEQAIVKGRVQFAVEYIISLNGLLQEDETGKTFVGDEFTREDKEKLRSIYKDFRTRDYIAAKVIESRTNHDIVAANTWVTIRGQQLGLDEKLLRRIIHFGRTSSDVNTNVTGKLYMKAFGEWTSALHDLVDLIQENAQSYENMTVVAETHGQPAQLTTLGHIYANFAEQIKLHANPLFEEKPFTLDGKLAGAIGTDADFAASFPDIDPTQMYKHLVEDVFGLNYTELGNDQDCTNASLCRMMNIMADVGMVIKKAATDQWIYASKKVVAKMTQAGESGSSAMPQKANPFLAEGCEALMAIVASLVNPLKEAMVAYRGQGDLRRSITKREGFHPIMLSTIGIRRIIEEMKKYEPNVLGMESAIQIEGPKIASSVINNYLRVQGVEDAYDRIKEVVMKPYVSVEDVQTCIQDLLSKGKLQQKHADYVIGIISSVSGNDNLVTEAYQGSDLAMQRLRTINSDVNSRTPLLGRAIQQTEKMIYNAEKTRVTLFLRYAA